MKRTVILLIVLIITLVSCGTGGKTIESEAQYSCTFSVNCTELLGSDKLAKEKRALVPEDGIIIAPISVSFTKGESLFEVTKRVLKEKKIHLEFAEVTALGTAYIEGINNIYEFDAGELSGWVFTVNGEEVNVGSSSVKLNDGDTVVWSYTTEGRKAS